MITPIDDVQTCILESFRVAIQYFFLMQMALCIHIYLINRRHYMRYLASGERIYILHFYLKTVFVIEYYKVVLLSNNKTYTSFDEFGWRDFMHHKIKGFE